MAVEQYANMAQSTLDAGIDDNDLTLVVVSAASFPSAGNFRIRIEDEILTVTGVAGTTFTVTRGEEGSVAAAHAGSVAVVHILTKESLEALAEVSSRSEVFASRPAAALAGRLHLPSDGPGLNVDTGAAWLNWGFLQKFKPPVDGDFSWVNQGTAVLNASYGMINIRTPAGAGAGVRARVMSAPATPYTVTACLLANHVRANYMQMGLLFRQTSDGKIVAFTAWDEITTGPGNGLVVQKYTDASTLNSSYKSVTFPKAQPIWLQISDDGSNRICRWSRDGISFRQFHSIGRTDWLTADQVGFFGYGDNATYDAAMTLLSWEIT